MGKTVWDVSASLDGFTSGPNVRAEEPMGDGGEHLHDWMAGGGAEGEVDLAVRRDVETNIGALVIGRRTFDLGLENWGGTPWPGIPSFVVTHRPRPDLVGDNGGTFAFDGLQEAARRALEAAGDGEVWIMGATVARQLLRAGLIDEIWLHIAPLLLGGGTPLFDGEQVELVPEGRAVAGTATHLRFRVGRSSA